MLTNVMTGKSRSGSGTAGTSAAGSTASTSSGSTSAAAKATYVLAGPDTELKKHVGHRVEVVGTLDSRSRSDTSGGTSMSGTTGTAAGSTASGSGAASSAGKPGAGAAMKAQRLRVSSVRMISSDCSDQ
jgi:hypothetical protein